jgi:zinc protease
VDANYSSVSIDPGGFTVTAQLMPGKEPPEVEREIDGLLEKIKSELISERELQKAKNQIESSFTFAQDSIFGQAMKIGYYETTGGWRQMDQYIDGIRQVTRDDVRRVAKQYLDRDHRTVGILIPTKEKHE